jgi:hypothetical protein
LVILLLFEALSGGDQRRSGGDRCPLAGLVCEGLRRSRWFCAAVEELSELAQERCPSRGERGVGGGLARGHAGDLGKHERVAGEGEREQRQ